MKRGRFRTGKRANIWLALTVALALHALFLILPLAGNPPREQDRQRPIEIQLAKAGKPASPPIAPAPETSAEPPHASAEPTTDTPLPREQAVPEKLAESPPGNAPPVPPAHTTPYRKTTPDFELMSEVERKVLANTILARQYMTEESAVDRLFGKPLAHSTDDIRKEFHYPLRPDLIEMLSQPLPDLPFEYTPGLIYFAYDPGLKGELQRFWDIITPEFGWRTKYGTEVRCALIVIIPGCVWK